MILSETGSFHCEAAGERCGGAWIEVVGGGCIRPDMMNSAGYFLITIFKKQLHRYKNISRSLALSLCIAVRVLVSNPENATESNCIIYCTILSV